jgi:hypothetical protein
MGMIVFLLIFLFWVGAFAMAKTGVGIGIAMALAMVMGMIGSTVGQGIPVTHFLIIAIGIFVLPALGTAISGLVRAVNGRPGAWTMFSWSISLAAFPLVAWRSFETLTDAWP